MSKTKTKPAASKTAGSKQGAAKAAKAKQVAARSAASKQPVEDAQAAIDGAQTGSVNVTAQDISYASITAVRDVVLTATTGSITGTSDGTITGSSVVDAIRLRQPVRSPVRLRPRRLVGQ